MSKTFIIGEAGVNHNGSLQLAIELVDIAVKAGLDAVKFQTWKTEHLLTKDVRKAEYQIKNTGSNESQYDMIKKLELSYGDFQTIQHYCNSKGILFLSTPADIESLDFLLNIDLSIIKLSSADLTNYLLLRHLASFDKEVILSTGMADIEEVARAIQVLTDNGTAKENISVLHCNTDYPTKMADVNLKAMSHIQEKRV